MQALNQLYFHNPIIFYSGLIIISLCVGSFLNVVIYRIPLMLQSQWRQDCHEFLELPMDESNLPEEKLSLALPNSYCPHCHQRIFGYHNIPVLSYLWLRGKCFNCKTRISPRYPLVEIMAAIFAVFCVDHFGLGWSAIFATVFCWTLLCLAFIDLDHQILPDNITLSLLWLGLIININGLFVSLESAIWGAAFGYLSLWGFIHLMKLLTGKMGMGHGDFKLMAAAGAWLGWQMLAQMIVLSALIGSVFGSLFLYAYSKDRQTPIPFGPYIAVAAVIALFWGHDINQIYLQLAGLG